MIVFPTCYNLESLGKSLTEVLSGPGTTCGDVCRGIVLIMLTDKRKTQPTIGGTIP